MLTKKEVTNWVYRVREKRSGACRMRMKRQSRKRRTGYSRKVEPPT